MTTSHETCSRGEVRDEDVIKAGPSLKEHRSLGEDQSEKGLSSSSRGSVKAKSGYFGVTEDISRKLDPRNLDRWKLFMTLPITFGHDPGQRKSKLKFLGFFPSAEAAGRVHDQVAYHVLGRR